MKRHATIPLAISALILAACQTTTNPGASSGAGVSPEEAGLLRVVGEAALPNEVARGLTSGGLPAAGRSTGRAAGLQTFCSGGAEILAINSDLDNAERSTCKALGRTWSAGQTANGVVTYVDYTKASTIFAQGIYN